MSYNIIKIMTDASGRKTHVLLLDGLSAILEIKELDKAFNMTAILNKNSDSGWTYEVKKGGKIIKKKHKKDS